MQKQLQKESNYVHCCQHFKTDIPIHGKHPLPLYKLRKNHVFIIQTVLAPDEQAKYFQNLALDHHSAFFSLLLVQSTYSHYLAL